MKPRALHLLKTDKVILFCEFVIKISHQTSSHCCDRIKGTTCPKKVLFGFIPRRCHPSWRGKLGSRSVSSWSHCSTIRKQAGLISVKARPQGHTSTGTVLPAKDSKTFYYCSTSWDQIVQTHKTMRDVSHPSHNSLHTFNFHLDTDDRWITQSPDLNLNAFPCLETMDLI